ncbi:hypothetical protein ERO13_A10G131300v2 [Gossypium hirsutum]|nr:hypothetical protein ERO13_A10G131300v2 [Gossypium hirsutum]KAG4179861.1 hypothetical protein ERO13_A10G131300v2 [Gossypium hirsutum]
MNSCPRKNKLNANGKGVICGNWSKVGLKVLRLISDNMGASRPSVLLPAEGDSQCCKLPDELSKSPTDMVDFVATMEGMGHPCFHNFVSEYQKEFQLEIVCLFETRTSGVRADRIISQIRMAWSCRIEANGFSSGIWNLWNEIVSIDILAIHPQMVHMKVCSKNDSSSFICTVVYASPQQRQRKDFWYILDVLNESERVGAASQSRLGCKWFQTFLFDYKIRDLGYSCSQFTWSRGNLSQRLDKVISNSEWDFFAPNYAVHNLHRLKLDNRPILVSLRLNFQWDSGPFQCLPSQMLHAEQEVEEILYHEELLWFQKSRLNWLSHGNRNKSYFHGRTLARQRRNKIKGLNLENDEWCFDDVSLKHHVLHYFKDLFVAEYSVNDSLPSQGKFPSISMADMECLKLTINYDEIHKAVFSMAPLKALGIYSFHAKFYEENWDIVGASICSMVRHIIGGNVLWTIGHG